MALYRLGGGFKDIFVPQLSEWEGYPHLATSFQIASSNNQLVGLFPPSPGYKARLCALLALSAVKQVLHPAYQPWFVTTKEKEMQLVVKKGATAMKLLLKVVEKHWTCAKLQVYNKLFQANE